MTEDLLTIATFLLVFVTASLVAVTFVYAFQAAKTVAEMKKARQTEIRPCLKLTIVRKNANRILMRIVNVGKGAAINVKVKYWLDGLEGKFPNYPFLMPGDYLETPIPKEKRILKMEASCENILGMPIEEPLPKEPNSKIQDKYLKKDKVDVKEMIDSLILARARYKEDMLRQIQRELEGIKKELRKIKRSR